MKFNDQERADILRGTLTASPSAVRLATVEQAFIDWYKKDHSMSQDLEGFAYEVWKAGAAWATAHQALSG